VSWFVFGRERLFECDRRSDGASSGIEKRGNEARSSIRAVGWIPLRARPASAAPNGMFFERAML
jgi:hypothetical protein